MNPKITQLSCLQKTAYCREQYAYVLKQLSLILLLVCLPFLATAQLPFILEFNTDGQGVVGACGVTANSCFSSNLPTAWTLTGNFTSLANNNDYFQTTDGSLEAQDLNSEICFETQLIDVSGTNAVSFAALLSERGNHEDDDYVDVSYAIDGGIPISIVDWEGDGDGPHTLEEDFDAANIVVEDINTTGASTLQIFICMDNDSSSERHKIDGLYVYEKVENPDLSVGSCDDFKVVLVLDESGSIGSSASEVRDAAVGLVNGLTGSGAELAVVEFASVASNSTIAGSNNYQMVTGDPTTSPGGATGYVAAFENYINNNYEPNSPVSDGLYTNWEDAMLHIQNLAVADLIIFVTDGDPTALNGGASCPSVCGGAYAYACSSCNTGPSLMPAVIQANIIKSQGSHMFVLGVGGNVDVPNVKAISGEDEDLCPENDLACIAANPSDPSFAEADYALIPFSELEACLSQIAMIACNTSIALEKTVYTGHDAGASCPGVENVSGGNGSPVTYCFTVTNTGDAPLEFVSFTDPSLGVNAPNLAAFNSNVNVLSGAWPLGIGQSISFYINSSITSNLVNTATVTGQAAGENPVSDTDDASVTLIQTPGCGDCMINGPNGSLCPDSYNFSAVFDDEVCMNASVSWTLDDNEGNTINYSGVNVLVDILDCDKTYTLTAEIDCDNCTPGQIVCNRTITTFNNDLDISACPADPDLGACITQNELDTAWDDWIDALNAMTATGNCNPMIEYSVHPNSLQKPLLCNNNVQSVSVSIKGVSACGETQPIACSFTLNAYPDNLSVNCPNNETIDDCISQVSVDAAFSTWLSGFSTSGGCNASSTDLTVFTAPNACTGGEVAITYNATDDCGQSASCMASFTVTARPTLSVNCPNNETIDDCISQVSVDAAFATWLSGFSTSGGCNASSTDLTAFTAPDACTGGEVAITYNATDDCGQSATCMASFTVTARPTLSVNCPNNETIDDCISQVSVDAAFATWLSGFSTSGGCNASSTDLTAFTAPDACTGGEVAITYNATDDCGQSATCMASFTVTARPTLTVSCPSNESIDGCISQVSVDAAFATWLSGFSTSGGCNATSTDLTAFTAPDVCTGGEVAITYNATDDCGQSATCMARFTVIAQPALSVECPSNIVVDACDSQADIDAAYEIWFSGFNTIGGCNPTSADLNNPTSPSIACLDEDVIVSITNEASDDCSAASCTASFTIRAQPALSVECPDNTVMAACDSQTDINTAYAAWLSGFNTIGGCDPISTDLSNYTAAPSACSDQDVVVSITYAAYDDCSQASCTASFTVRAQPALSVECPDNTVMAACDSQTDINTAYAEWLSTFNTIGGCDPISTDLSNYTAAPSACSDQDVVVSITYAAYDDCSQASCTASFTIRAQSTLSVECPDNTVMPACNSQAAINTAYAAWLSTFNTIGGCDPISTDLSNYTAAPSACSDQDVVVSITYAAYDDCSQASCTASFTVRAQPALSVECPDNTVMAACNSQAAINTAYAEWLSTFNTIGGCDPISTDLSNYTAAPSACSDQDVVVSITYAAYDDCSQASCTASFTIRAQPALSVECPGNTVMPACNSQAAINTAYAEWLSGFNTIGGCDPISTDLSNYTAAPSACSDQDVVVSITYAAYDDCSQASCTASFTVRAQPALSVECPNNTVMPACNSQAAINTAYAEWLSTFNTIGGCDPISTDLSNYTAAPSACSDQDVVVSITYAAYDDCSQASCTASFTVRAQPALSVECPDNTVMAACDSQAAINTAYAAWLSGFNTIGGCDPISTDLSNYTAAPSACSDQDVVVSITYAAYDDCSQASCTASFTVRAQPALSVECPDNTVMAACDSQADINTAYAAWLSGFNTIGGCDPISTDLSNYTAAPSACSDQDVVVSITYAAYDDCSQASCTASFTVRAQPALSVACPDDVIVGPCATQAEVNIAYVAWLSSFATIGGCEPENTDLSEYNLPPVICQDEDVVVNITYAALDDCSAASCTATFTVQMDVDAPEITTQAQDMLVECDGAGNEAALAAWLASQGGAIATDNCVVHWTNDFNALSDECGATGSATVTFTATDDCGNSSETTASFTIQDTSPPTISFDVPDQTTMVVECNNMDPDWTPFTVGVDDLTIEDECSENIEVTYEEILLEEGICGVSDFLSLWQCTWTATDECGLSSSFTLFVRIVDTQAPTWLDFPENVTLSCEDDLSPKTYPTAVDDCSEFVITYEDFREDGICDYNYTIARVWTVTDGCGNARSDTQYLFVVDETAPTIVFTDGYVSDYTANEIVYVECSEWGNILNLGTYAIAATDNCGVDISLDFWYEDHGQFNCAEYGYSQRITTYWSASDVCGNESIVYLDWYLIDEQAPMIQGVPADICVSTLPPVPTNVQAVDDCEYAQLVFEQSDVLECEQGGQYVERTWTAYDFCGNSSSATQQITLVNPNGPSIQIDYPGFENAVDGQTVVLEANGDCSELLDLSAYVTIEETCVTTTHSYQQALLTIGDCASGFLARYSVEVRTENTCGISSLLRLIVELQDNQPPAFTDVASTITIDCAAELPLPNVLDECTTVESLDYVLLEAEHVNCLGQSDAYDVEWTAVDACGNTSTFVQSVVRVDQTGPVLSGLPEDACNEAPNAVVTAYDVCQAQEVAVTYNESALTMDDCGMLSERRWTATDACGNVSEAIRYVYFEDDQAPVLSFVDPLLYSYEDGGEYMLQTADLSGTVLAPEIFSPASVAAVDNCMGDLEVSLSTTLLEAAYCQNGAEYMAQHLFTWTATDACGNSASISIKLYIIDDYAPDVYHVPADMTLYCVAQNELPAVEHPLVIDDYDEDPALDYEQEIVPTDYGYHVIRSWTASDQCANTTSVYQHIYVMESDMSCEFNLSPQELSCNSDGNMISVEVNGGTAPYTYYWDMTDCDGYLTSDPTNAYVAFTVGYTTQHFTVSITDANGCEHICNYSVVCEKDEREDTDVAIGLQDHSNNDGVGAIHLYPNPVDKNLNVKWTGEQEELEFELYNVYGKLVKRYRALRLANGTFSIPTLDLTNGTYWLHTHNAQGELMNKQFVVLHK